MKADAFNTFLNIGSGKGTKLEELAKMLLKLTNSSKLIQYKLIENTTLVKKRIGCVKKAKKEIGFVFGCFFEHDCNFFNGFSF